MSPSSQLPISIIGAGGIGCTLAHSLVASGADVELVERDPRKRDWARRHGVGVESYQPVFPRLVTFDDWHPDPARMLLLCVKCYDNDDILTRIPGGAALVPVQNGFDPALAAIEGIEGIASFVAECPPGRTHVRITRKGDLHLGRKAFPSSLQRWGITSGAMTSVPSEGVFAGVDGLTLLQRHLRRGPFRLRVVGDILPYKFTKLMYNAAIGPLASAVGIDNGELLRDARLRSLFFGLLQENYRILCDAGVPLGRIGPFHPDTVQRLLRHRWLARLLSRAFYPSLRGTYCSMHDDLPRGRTEIDFYNGFLIRLASGRPCPLNRWLVDLVHGMETDRIPPSRQLLEAFPPPHRS